MYIGILYFKLPKMLFIATSTVMQLPIKSGNLEQNLQTFYSFKIDDGHKFGSTRAHVQMLVCKRNINIFNVTTQWISYNCQVGLSSKKMFLEGKSLNLAIWMVLLRFIKSFHRKKIKLPLPPTTNYNHLACHPIVHYF